MQCSTWNIAIRAGGGVEFGAWRRFGPTVRLLWAGQWAARLVEYPVGDAG